MDGQKEVETSSGLFLRLDRWLAGELMKSLKSIPELSFRVQGYVEGCTRNVQAPRGHLAYDFQALDLDGTGTGGRC